MRMGGSGSREQEVFAWVSSAYILQLTLAGMASALLKIRTSVILPEGV